MITPGFFGLFNAHRGLVAAQNALSTISHNISNSNTEGYSRQRVDLQAYTAYTIPTPYGPNMHQIGQGPIVQQITRSRDLFLDAQYRQSNGILGMNANIRDALQQIEGILTEPSTSGINTVIQNFFDAAQELSLHPESIAVRSDFVQQAADMLTVFQQQGLQLLDLRRNLVGDPLVPTSIDTSQLAINVNDVNNLLEGIASINQGIVSIQASGANPNDLFDQRDLMLDQLSQIVDIDVTHFESGQINLSIAGNLMVRGAAQIDSLEVIANPGGGPLTPDEMPAWVRTTANNVILNDGVGSEITSGKIKGIIDMGGVDPTLSTVPNVLSDLDNLLQTIVDEINLLQQNGRDLNGNANPPDLFLNNPLLNPGQPLNIFHWEINSVISADPSQVAAAIDGPGFAGAGDGRNALAMAQLRDQAFVALGTTFIDYFNGTVSRLGIDARSYENTSGSQTNLLNSIDVRRQSIFGVNVDEEMIDMLRYQRAFEATSKTIQMFDEVAQTIIQMT